MTTGAPHDKRGAMQFQAQVWAPGKKTSGAPNWRRKEKKINEQRQNYFIFGI